MMIQEVSNDKKYQKLSIWFTALLFIVVLGFSKTYLVFFPTFNDFRFVHHFHSMVMLLWLIMLIIQPWLISKGLVHIHKFIGRTSYFVAPLVAISMFVIGKEAYYHPPFDFPEIVKLAMQALSVPIMIAFIIFYLTAILNTHNTQIHMRFMIGTAILMLGPGLGRIFTSYLGTPFPPTVTAIKVLEMLIITLLLLSDSKRKKIVWPFQTIFIVLLITVIIWFFRFTPPWQSFAKWYVGSFY